MSILQSTTLAVAPVDQAKTAVETGVGELSSALHSAFQPVINLLPSVLAMVAVLVVGFMAVSAYYVHAANGFLWIKGGFEYPLFWGLVALAIAVRGGGPKSLDARMKRQF